MGALVVVGLGPAGADLLVPAARAALDTAAVRFVRTRRHPAVAQLEDEGITWTSFDDVYDAATDLDAAYAAMVDRLVAALAAATGTVVYAVPGSPAVAERTVALLRERGVVFDVVPGLSFADLAWARVGVDPMVGGARVVDARAIDEVELSGPLLVAQCDHPLVLSDVKLSLLEHLDPATEVVVLQRLGSRDEHLSRVPVVELDRAVEPDHLTSLFVDVPVGDGAAAREVARLLQLARRLRGPGGCPWDAEQTHRSLTRYVVEEAYEVVEAIDALPDGPGSRSRELEGELGDLLYQVVFHAVIAEEDGAFGMAGIARAIHDKLVRRHPHVFGDVVADEAADVVRNWEQIKRDERGTTSIVDGIPGGLPSLLHAQKLLGRAASVGLDPGSRDDALARIDATVARVRSGGDVGPVLAAVVAFARAQGVDAETALRGWAARYRARLETTERLATERGVDLATADPATAVALWLEAASQPRSS